MEAVEHVAHFKLVFVGKDFLAVEIFVGCNLIIGQKAHDYTEQVFLTVDYFFRVI